MASLIPSGSASGTGSMTLLAPTTNSNQTATLPDATGTVMVSGNMPAFSVTNNGSAQSVSNATWTKVLLNTKDFDTASAFDATTNYRFTPQVNGYYQFSSFCSGPSSNTQNQITAIYKNGSLYKYLGSVQNLNATSVTNDGVSGSVLVPLNGSTDYVELWLFQQTGGTVNTAGYVYLTGYLTRSA
jgi:hypothetical protein